MNNQYIYTLRLIPALIDEANWTDRENNIVANHFAYLQEAKKNGQLILAGRTLNMDENTFGIVIFKAESKQIAEHFMGNDPAVKEGIMISELYPYKVALISEENV